MNSHRHPLKASVATVVQPVVLVQSEQRRRRRGWILVGLGISLAIAAVLAIVIPLAIIIPHKKSHVVGSRSVVIVPLYIYPGQNAWDPLFNAISRRPNLSFLVVINPDNGPGSTDLPDQSYISQIQKLNDYSNVQTIGYVPTARATRNVGEVIADVATYAGWSTRANKLAMNGIFFDEAPADYSESAVEYLTQINAAVKNMTGISGNRTIVHNPGKIPDAQLRVALTDIQVIVENTYTGYNNEELKSQLKSVAQDRSGVSYMIHSVPDNVNLGELVAEVSQRADYLFISDLSVAYYESFGKTWDLFVDAVPT